MAIEFFNIEHVLATFGVVVLFFIIFAETGLLLGFFLPGDTLLFTAGLLASQGKLDLFQVLIGCVFFAIIGNFVGYWIGKTFGKSVFEKSHPHFLDSYLNRENLRKTHDFFEKYGDKTIVLARFVPVIRTVAPTLAGTAEMSFSKFAAYTVLGALAWVGVAVLAGFYLGELLPPWALDAMALVLVLVVVASIAPVIFKALQKKFGLKS